MVAVAAGLTLGPLVSGVLATVGPSPTVAPVVLDIVLAVALALALLRIPETRPGIAGNPVRAPALRVPASIRRTWAATTLASAPGWMFMGWILGLSPSFLHEQLGIHISQPIVAGLFAGAVVFTNGRTQVILRRHHENAGLLRLGVALITAGLAGFALSPHTGGLVAALVGGMIGGVGGGIVQPNTMATIQAIAPDHAHIPRADVRCSDGRRRGTATGRAGPREPRPNPGGSQRSNGPDDAQNRWPVVEVVAPIRRSVAGRRGRWLQGQGPIRRRRTRAGQLNGRSRARLGVGPVPLERRPSSG
jgi:hypothetical protein